MTLIDAQGYVLLNGRRVHIEVLRSCDLDLVAQWVEVPPQRLLDWARGPGLSLGLPWPTEVSKP